MLSMSTDAALRIGIAVFVTRLYIIKNGILDSKDGHKRFGYLGMILCFRFLLMRSSVSRRLTVRPVPLMASPDSVISIPI